GAGRSREREHLEHAAAVGDLAPAADRDRRLVAPHDLDHLADRPGVEPLRVPRGRVVRGGLPTLLHFRSRGFASRLAGLRVSFASGASPLESPLASPLASRGTPPLAPALASRLTSPFAPPFASTPSSSPRSTSSKEGSSPPASPAGARSSPIAGPWWSLRRSFERPSWRAILSTSFSTQPCASAWPSCATNRSWWREPWRITSPFHASWSRSSTN